MNDSLNILVVDDNEDLLDTSSLIFKRAGFSVVTASNGRTAVDMFRDGEFDIALMDIVLPEMNGVEAFRLIRKMNPDTPVILMTGYSDEELEELAVREGARCVMHKPLRVDKMIQIIKDVASESPVSSFVNEPDNPDRVECASVQDYNRAALVTNR